MGASPIRVLLVEDHTFLREALALALAREPDLAVVGQAGSLAEARSQLDGVDVAILDLALPDGDGADLIPELHAANPVAVALVLTASGGLRDAARAVEAGAADVVHKSAPLATVIDALRRLGRGEPAMPSEDLVELLRLAGQERRREEAVGRALTRLTPREREVLAALAEGLSDAEIGRRLCVSPETVHSHVLNLLRKLGAASRLQALVLAVRHGAVRIE